MGRIIENLCEFPFQCNFTYAGQLFLIVDNTALYKKLPLLYSPGRDSSEIDLDDGDLLKLSVAAGGGAFRGQSCVATNQATGHTGQVNSCHLHILVTLAAPSSDYLVGGASLQLLFWECCYLFLIAC